MRRNAIFIILLITVAAVAASFAIAPRRDAVTGPTVAVTSFPLRDVVASVAGPSIRVITILPPGANAHTFDPTPATARELSGASVVYAIGHGFDAWIDTLLADAYVPKIIVDQGIELRESAEHADEEDGDEEEHGPEDPHYWLVARNMAVVARTVAADLTTRFPDRIDEIAANLAVTEARLLAADAEITRLLADVPRKDIVTLHDAWYYFADAYGLTIIGSFEPSAAREPSPRYLAEMEKAVRRAGVSVVYKEPGLPTSGLETFAADNGLRIVALDTVEGAADEPYDVIMIRNATLIKENQR
jgi:ABC-type Zn uptake system ZnuABC Zn-binding protein ZnuA